MSGFDSALQAMRDYGLLIDAIRSDGRYHHVAVDGGKKGKRSGWYICSEIRLSSGDIALIGAYGNYLVSEDKIVLKPETKGFSKEERAEFEAKRAETQRITDEQREKAKERAKRVAASNWSWAKETWQSDYLKRKQVLGIGTKVDKHGTLLVPVRDWEEQLLGLQYIPAEPGAVKIFNKGTPKIGAFHRLGSFDDRGPIVLAEGYATAASCRMATNWVTLACFDAGNLAVVAKALRARLLDRPILIAGDDDHELTDKKTGEPDNVGRKKATSAARAVRAHLAFPKFRRGKGKSDFNDLHVEEGIERVGEILRDAYASEPAGGDALKPPPPDGLVGEFDFSLGGLLDRYTLVYGTTAVFDAVEHQLIELTALRVAATNKVANRWLKHPERRIVRKDDVVFDPTGRAQAHQVNLFRGMPMQPKEGKSDRIYELLHYLCGESDNTADWLMKWIAYPLQHVGAKMQTAVVMHGPEGTGKNLLWSVVQAIYGHYSTSINQHQLEGRFNGWASAKLFIVGNEVVSRSELYHAKGGVKTMITEPKWQIEEKHLPGREERNFANIVFLSNVLQPVAPDPDDRHYMILWTPPAREESWYQAIAAEIEAGGVEAFYHRLMTLDLEGFSPHTKPPMTDAKRDLIELSIDTPERFWRQWSAGELKQPYLPAPSMLVYGAYVKWAERRGEKPLREVVFIAQLRRHMWKVKKRYHTATDEVQRWFLMPPDWRPAEGVTEVMALTKCVDFFRGREEEAQYAS